MRAPNVSTSWWPGWLSSQEPIYDSPLLAKGADHSNEGSEDFTEISRGQQRQRRRQILILTASCLSVFLALIVLISIIAFRHPSAVVRLDPKPPTAYAVSVIPPAAAIDLNIITPLYFNVSHSPSNQSASYAEFKEMAGKHTLHVTLVSPGANAFGHVHPEDFDANAFMIKFRFPFPGTWAVGVGYRGGSVFANLEIPSRNQSIDDTQLGSPAWNTTGLSLLAPDDRFTEPIIFSQTTLQKHGKYVMQLSGASNNFTEPFLSSSACSLLYLTVADASTQSRVTDLRSYLDMPAHIVFTKADQSAIQHVHGVYMEENATASPDLCRPYTSQSTNQGQLQATTVPLSSGAIISLPAPLSAGLWTAVVQLGRGVDEMIIGRFVIKV
ncbi:hypothetical protein DFS34DRAFT_644269 [Phlyctochytrium arcticum]|nr:hypothetical protein DFS34DRAFT_644269 [Phlyctochytrium arcticum]